MVSRSSILCVLACVFVAACSSSRTRGEDSGVCGLRCAPVPLGCHAVGAGPCACGTIVCDDGAVVTDAGDSCIECTAPDPGCRYEGGTCESCGAIVCDDVVCGGAEPRFPSFANTCSTVSDCIVALHQTDCCGTRAALGIRAEEAARFAGAEAACVSMYPGCGCDSGQTHTDSGETTYDASTIRIACAGKGICWTYVDAPPPP